MPQPTRKGGSANTRSKSGCLTCRSRKVKCDEAKPGCLMCTRLRLSCNYGTEGKTTCLHDRRLGAGPIKKRQFTNWQPQKIVPKTPTAAAAPLAAVAAPSSASAAPIVPAAVASPGPSVTSISSTLSSLSSPSVSATPPYFGTTSTANNNMAAFTPAPEYVEFRPNDSSLPPNTEPIMTTCGPITTASTASHLTSTITDANLDFSYIQDDLLASTSMRTPPPFSFIPTMDDADYMFFNDLSTPLSPLLPASAIPLGALTCAAPTPLPVEENQRETTNCNSIVQKSSSSSTNSAFHIVSAPTPSPMTGLVLGTTTIVLASFPSRMRLTERDFEALLLFHQQVGFSIGSKSPVWSTHAILIKLAVHHAPILHLLLAASYGELDWRLNAESGAGGAAGSQVTLPAPPITKGGSGTPRQLAQRHYEAGQAALKELAVAPQGTPEAGLYHVVVIACFWLEYLIQRRNTLGHGRWGSNNEFSKAMGNYMRKYRLRRGLMGSEAPPSPALPAFSSKRPPSPPKLVPVADGEDADSDDEDDETEVVETMKQPATNTMLTEPTNTATHPIKSSKGVVHADRPLPPVKYRSFLSRLLSWLYWSDCAACFFGKGGGLATQFRMPPRSQLGFYEKARTTLLDFWDDYTPEEIADDNQNWPALQLINETWVAVHRLNLVYETEESQSQNASEEPPETVAQIARDVCALRSRYTTVFRLSAFTATSGGHRSRLLAMADWAVCHYLALELHLLRAGATREDLYGEEGPENTRDMGLLGGLESNNTNYDYNYNYGNYQQQNPQQRQSSFGGPSSRPQAVAAQIVHLAERAIRTVGPVELDRYQWPLFWAGVETDNHVYRYFVLSNLINTDFRSALQAVIREQTGFGAGVNVNVDPTGANGSEIGYYAMTGGTGVSIRRLRTICRAVGMEA